MCYSLGASIIAFSIDIIAAIILYFNLLKCLKTKRRIEDDKVFAYVILGLSTMQFAELIIHTDMDCTGTNESGSRLAYFSLLFLQPIFSYFGIAYHGVNRLVNGLNIIPAIWTVSLVVYAINAAYITKDQEYYSITLDRNVSNWCTAEFVCADTGCPLDWKFDFMNDSWLSWILYFLLAIGLPIVSLESWELWILLFVVFIIVQQTTQADILRLSASCYWLPMLTIMIQISTLPPIFSKWIRKIYMRCRGYRPT